MEEVINTFAHLTKLYGELLPSVVVRRQSFPQKPLVQYKPNLAGIFLVGSHPNRLKVFYFLIKDGSRY
jgi:hypothetical protein